MFTEPAPVDALMLALVVLLPTLGLVAINPALVAYFALWAVAGAAAVLAAALSQDTTATLIHVGVTLYLYLASVVLAAFVAKSPQRHTELILKAWTWGAFAAAAAALVGYFGLLPGTYDLFTKFGRASRHLQGPERARAVPRRAAALHAARRARALVLAHDRAARRRGRAGACRVRDLLARRLDQPRRRDRRLRLSHAAHHRPRGDATQDHGAAQPRACCLPWASSPSSLQTDYIADLLVERSSVTMDYDTGEEGRFGGQEKAIGLIADNPLGIGAQQFVMHHHPEEVHNVYLSMLLNAGWLGGGVYWILVALTIVLGFRHALKATPTRPLFLIVYASFVAVALEGAIIDTDHWRHFYLLMAIIWGLMCATAPDVRRQARTRAFASRRCRAPHASRRRRAPAPSPRYPLARSR